MYSAKFKEAGHEVAVAKDGESALVSLKEDAFDAVLLDMIMPGIDGVTLLESACKSAGAHGTKCIVLSNQGEAADKERATAAGAVGYIVKAECIPSEVVEKVEALCKGQA